jgi:hypothetical protein
MELNEETQARNRVIDFSLPWPSARVAFSANCCRFPLRGGPSQPAPFSPPERPKAIACGLFCFFLAIDQMPTAYARFLYVQIPNLIPATNIDELERSGMRPSTVGHFCCAENAISQLCYFLKGFLYDLQLLAQEQVDEKALPGLQGVVKKNHAMVNRDLADRLRRLRHGKPMVRTVRLLNVSRSKLELPGGNAITL